MKNFRIRLVMIGVVSFAMLAAHLFDPYEAQAQHAQQTHHPHQSHLKQ